ncbi:MAG: chorismate mutase, partial [Burkholderiales bacterium]|nr:chorismate mutase [Burkholderiales bacterium]
MADLNELRKKIDAIDDEVLSLLSRRAGIAQEVGHTKAPG